MSYRRVTFEAELDVEGLPEGLSLALELDDAMEDRVTQTVQDAVGHTGAIVTQILYVDAST